MKNPAALAFSFVFTLAGSLSALADVSFLDTTFSDTNWVPKVSVQSGGGGGASGSPTNFGGNDFLQLTVSNNGNRSGVAASWHSGIFTYDPATQGGISNLDYSLQLMAISSVNITPTAFASPAILQNGAYFVASPLTTGSGVWMPLSVTGLTSNSFGNLMVSNGQIFSGTAHPNFTSTGAPMVFGFVSVANTGSGFSANSATFAADECLITVHSIRQPPLLGILTIAGVQINGISNHNYLVEYTPTVGPPNWQTLTNLVLPAAQFTVYDYSSPGNSQRFYRATDVTP